MSNVTVGRAARAPSARIKLDAVCVLCLITLAGLLLMRACVLLSLSPALPMYRSLPGPGLAVALALALELALVRRP